MGCHLKWCWPDNVLALGLCLQMGKPLYEKLTQSCYRKKTNKIQGVGESWRRTYRKRGRKRSGFGFIWKEIICKVQNF